MKKVSWIQEGYALYNKGGLLPGLQNRGLFPSHRRQFAILAQSWSSWFFHNCYISMLARFWIPTWSKNPSKIGSEGEFLKVRSRITRFSEFWRRYWTECKVLKSHGFQKSSQNRSKFKQNTSKRLSILWWFSELLFNSFLSILGVHLGLKISLKPRRGS